MRSATLVARSPKRSSSRADAQQLVGGFDLVGVVGLRHLAHDLAEDLGIERVHFVILVGDHPRQVDVVVGIGQQHLVEHAADHLAHLLAVPAGVPASGS